MIGVIVANSKEWLSTKEFYKVSEAQTIKYPFGEYFLDKLKNKKVVFFWSGARKVPSSAATQYMIDKFKLTKVIVAGTCAGISTDYKTLDIFAPNQAVQYDTTVKENEPFLRERFIVDLDIERYNLRLPKGIIGTADKPVVMWKDYLELQQNNITIADTESGAVAYVCKLNNIECIILKGISDFPIKDIEIESKRQLAHDEQYNVFVRNIPIIMNKIFADYIHKIL